MTLPRTCKKCRRSFIPNPDDTRMGKEPDVCSICRSRARKRRRFGLKR